MPELPEVETVKNDLAPNVTGLTVTGLEVTWPKAVKGSSPEGLKTALVGRRIVEVARRAKYLLFRLDDGRTLVVHLKMTGALLWTEGNCRSGGPYIRTVIYLDRGCIEFRDPRKFGSLWLTDDETGFLRGLGPEPLEPAFTAEVLARILSRRSAPVKAVLLDQTALAGLGNMYADEALFEARIHPLKKAGELGGDETKRLHRAIRLVLRKGVEAGGASVATYFRPDGSKGYSQEQFRVAHQRNGVCPRCGGGLEYIKVRGRGTIFCPKCQKL
ncbi:MAG: bifunctional DNA-formamidopyrimidine glycosylase/DNA-(apurinic or apyrimidinic site) lyase [Chloroflexi bacterium]|nr:bifunctional DNA-formamidopyrimidine glycosylase/DNA-(apurinic or apyrimidinic site) lyase [Chloroflexota bacterium]